MKKNLLKKLAKKTGTSGFVIFLLLFALGAFQMRPAPDPLLHIETDRGCEAQFTLSEKSVLSFWMTGAAPDSEYLYWAKVYDESGVTLCGWRGTVATDSAGSTPRIDIEHIISLPVGQQYAEVTIPELGLQSTCLFYVGGHTEIPPMESGCYCEELTLMGILDKEVVTPGDTLTLTIRVRNDMSCGMIIATQPPSGTRPCYEIQPLVVDLGALGGKVCPLAVDRKVDPHTTSDITTYTITVPNLEGGTYPINLEYAFSYCTWAAYVQVDVTPSGTPSGTLSVVSSPPVTKNREGSIVLEVGNPNAESTTYTVVATPPDGITLLNDPTTALSVPGHSAGQMTVPFIGEKEGEYILNLTLFVGDAVVSRAFATVEVTGFKGALELVSPPSGAKPNEAVTLKFRVTNTSPVDTTYTLAADVSEEFTVKDSLSVSLPAGETADLSLPVTPVEEGSFQLTFDLFCEGDLVDSIEWIVTVEQGTNIVVIAAVAAVGATGAGVAFAAKSALSKHGLTEEGESTAEFQSGEEKARALQKISETTEEQGNLEESAELYEKTAQAWKQINRIEQAADIYKKGADIHEKLKRIKESLKDREKAALLFEKAAGMAEESGSFEKAASLCEKAAGEWQKTRKVDKAGQEFEKTAYLLVKAGNTERAREVQEMAAHAYEEAASLGMEIKEFRAAGTFYEKAGSLYREAGKTHEASQVYNKAEDLWSHVQDLDKRQKTEETLGATYEEEARKAEERGDYEKAALSYEKAADTWRKVGDQPRATQDEQKALELYDKMNR
jgi:tetratricopeptide (TPR) repeat protein